MTEPKPAEEAPGMLSDLPLQPTGSGVADLEIAYEQMKLTEDAETVVAPTPAANADDAESIAHPS